MAALDLGVEKTQSSKPAQLPPVAYICRDPLWYLTGLFALLSISNENDDMDNAGNHYKYSIREDWYRFRGAANAPRHPNAVAHICKR